jgi:hypothetical protein
MGRHQSWTGPPARTAASHPAWPHPQRAVSRPTMRHASLQNPTRSVTRQVHAPCWHCMPSGALSGTVMDEFPPKTRITRDGVNTAIGAEVVAAQHGAASLGAAYRPLLTQPWLASERASDSPPEDRLSLVDTHVVTSSTCTRPGIYPPKLPLKRAQGSSTSIRRRLHRSGRNALARPIPGDSGQWWLTSVCDRPAGTVSTKAQVPLSRRRWRSPPLRAASNRA